MVSVFLYPRRKKCKFRDGAAQDLTNNTNNFIRIRLRLDTGAPPSNCVSNLTKHSLERATLASLSGLASALRSERAFRLEVAVLAVSVPASFILTPDVFRRAELIACLIAVLAVELLNTSIEKLCDRTTPQIDPAIKIVKDMGSAAVFCALCMAGALWIGAALARFA